MRRLILCLLLPLFLAACGAEVEVIRVAEDDLRAGAADLVGMDAAHRPVGAHRHERRRLHRAVRQREGARTRRAAGGLEPEVEHR